MERARRLEMNNDRRDLLVSRLIAGEAEREELIELSEVSASDPAIWFEVVEGARDDAHLMRVMDGVAAVADRVMVSPPQRGGRGWWRLSGFTGWTAAAVLAVIAFAQPQLLPGRPGGDAHSNMPQHASVPGLTSARDAFETYLDRGREEGLVLSEQPRRLLLEARPASSGSGFEVIYMQQILEKTVVPNLYEVGGQDEQGRAVLVRFQEPVRDSM